MNNFKLRYSYGSLGNQLVGYYDYIRKIAIGTGSYTFGSGSKPTIATIGAPVASNLTWEKTLQHDLGVDLAFFGNRLMFTADAYIRDTKDMLTAGVALPAVYGASSPKMNAADLRTKGYEFQLSWRDGFNLFGKPFNYSVTASFSDYITEITKFDNPERTFAKSYYVGMRMGEIWGYHTGGLFRSDAEAADYKIDQTFVNQAIISAAGDERGLHGGDVKFLDLNGDGVVNQGKNTVDDPGDRTIIGNNQPRYNYGINLSLQYFGFDFGIFFQGVGKMDWAPAANNSPDQYLLDKATGYPNVTGPNTGVILEIRRERAVELFDEGFRFYDLIRWKNGQAITHKFLGMYIPGPGTYDLDGNGTPDVCFYKDNEPAGLPTGVVRCKIGERIFFTEGDHGYVDVTPNLPGLWNEARDYYYPIPTNELTLNPNLEQNPEWTK